MKDTPGFKIVNNIIEGDVMTLKRPYTNLGAYIFNKLSEDNEFVGQVDAISGKEDTFGEMKDRSVRCALWMKKNGIKPDDVIMFCTNNHLNNIIPCFAAFYIGAIYNPLEPSMSARDMEHIMKITKPKMAFVNASSAETVAIAAKRANLVLKIIVFETSSSYETFSQILSEQNATDVNDFWDSNIMNTEKPDLRTALIMCSSGSTGMPKGVAINHDAMLTQIETLDFLNMRNKTIMVLSTPYWISNILFTLLALDAKCKKIVLSVFEEDLTCRLIEKWKVQWVFTGSSKASHIVKSGSLEKYDLSSVEQYVLGGGHISQEFLELIAKHLPNALINNLYGMTELCGLATSASRIYRRNTLGSCGYIVKNTRLKVVDPVSGKVLGPNEKGEFHITSTFMMKQYYGNLQATKESLDEEGWLRTGDEGFYDEDGQIYIVDRIKDLINYQSIKISPGEIEGVLLQHPDVLDAAVIGVPNDVDYEHPKAFIVRSPGSKVTEKELEDLVAAELGDLKKIRGGVIFLNQMPTTPTGKIKKKELKSLATQASVVE